MNLYSAILNFRKAFDELTSNTKKSGAIVVSAESQCCVAALGKVQLGGLFDEDGKRTGRAHPSDSSTSWKSAQKNTSRIKCLISISMQVCSLAKRRTSFESSKPWIFTKKKMIKPFSLRTCTAIQTQLCLIIVSPCLVTIAGRLELKTVACSATFLQKIGGWFTKRLGHHLCSFIVQVVS